MIDKQRMQQHFSRQAIHYDANTVVQKLMGDELMALISTGRKPERAILDVGCGTGGLLGRLTQCFPDTPITAVDIAPGMIAVARGKFPSQRIRFICGDIETMDLEQTYDLIVSNAAFQWLNQPGATIGRLFQRLTPYGRLAFATFGPETFQELHQSYQLACTHLGIQTEAIPGQRFLSCAKWESLCHENIASCEADYQLTGREQRVIQYYRSAREFLHSVKKSGANNSNQKHCFHPALTRKLLKIYDEKFRVGDQIRVTYHCIYWLMCKRGEGDE